MGYERLKEVVDESYTAGKHWFSSYRKVPAIGSVQGSTVDLSMAPGNPRPNYYVGNVLEATQLNGNYGIWNGGSVSPATKHIHKVLMGAVNTAFAPGEFYLLDYLLFYPFIDMDSTDEQFFDNTVKSLPRYTDGEGVCAFLVAMNPYLGGAQFFINYTNQNGESGRISPPMTSNTNTFIGTLLHSGVQAFSYSPFIPTLPGDYIRSVESITFFAPNGGLACLVLCMPLANNYLREITVPSEWDFLTMKNILPRIYDGAYLNFLCTCNATVAAQNLYGYTEFIWN